MASLFILNSKTLNFFTCLLLLATTLSSSARTLDELTPPIPLPTDGPSASDPIVPSPEADTPDLPSGQIPAIPATNLPQVIPTEPEASAISPVPDVPDTDEPLATTTPLPPVSTPTTLPTRGSLTPGPPLAATTSVAPVSTPTTLPTGGSDGQSTISFFMHDILGGSSPSARVVTGIVTNTNANNLPFSKPNNQVFPVNGGVPLNNINGVVNNNNYPFLVGLNGGSSNGNNNNNNNNNNQAFVTGGQLPQGLSLQQLMFGSVTVVDNEITEGHELGTGVLGRAQGFYIASSSDVSSHTLVLTALFHGGEVEDTISFFGVHRTATPISHLAIVGGTGKYGEAKGHATIETLPHEDQHTTDGVETITHFTVYITP